MTTRQSVFVAILLSLHLQPVMAQSKEQVVDLQVTEKGFEPSTVDVKPGIPVILKVTRKTDSTCATQIKIQSKNIKKDLPLNKMVTVDIGKLDILPKPALAHTPIGLV